MNSAIFLTAALALCMLPSALSLKCYHCQASLASQKLCTNMSDYVEQTCMSENATCGKTELMSNASSVVKGFTLGCVEEPHTCMSYNSSICDNATTTLTPLDLYLTSCETECCDTDLCNSADMSPTTSSTMESSTVTGTMETTTADAQVFRPERIGMFIALMAVFFALQ